MQDPQNGTRRRALIIGGGIAGPVVAMALQRVGIDPILFEAHEGDADHVGSFLNTASNAIDALRTLGAERGVLDRGFPTPAMVMWSATGKRLGVVDGGAASTTIRRGALHRALVDEAAVRGVARHAGKRLVGVAHADRTLTARFADGTHATGDLLVGADGLHSVTRRLIDRDAPAPRYLGQLSIGGVAPMTAFERTPGAYHMIFGRRGFFGYSVTPDGDAYWFANLAAPVEPTRGELDAIPPGEWAARLIAMFDGDAGPAVAMIGATRDIVAYPLHDMPAVPRWHARRMVLVGDSAHATSPSSGQGAAMAIEDAVVLAKCLRDIPELDLAFAAYERLRRPRVERVVRYSARIGQSKVPGPVGRFFRDLFMPIGLRLVAGKGANAWLYDHHIDWNDAVRA